MEIRYHIAAVASVLKKKDNKKEPAAGVIMVASSEMLPLDNMVGQHSSLLGLISFESVLPSQTPLLPFFLLLCHYCCLLLLLLVVIMLFLSACPKGLFSDVFTSFIIDCSFSSFRAYPKIILRYTVMQQDRCINPR